MRGAIANADVGDDVFGEDPTVNQLQDQIKKLTGKEAALFVSSGTQANQTALNSHTSPGDEVICEYLSHIFNFEAGAAGMLSGIQLHPLKGSQGVLDTGEVKAAIRPADHHFPRTRLICIENTHNRQGGKIYPLEEIKALRKLADEYNLKMHMDGARLWNASIATGIPIIEYASYFDSISLCFSKGLGAPVGSVLAGSEQFIEKAHYYRKAYGGGLRQSGLLAAAAIYALDNNFKRLADDHTRAKKIAEYFNSVNGLSSHPDDVDTNIVFVNIIDNKLDAFETAEKLKENGILVLPVSANQLRIVTHLGIEDRDVEYVGNKVKNVF